MRASWRAAFFFFFAHFLLHFSTAFVVFMIMGFMAL
jgi:hypothetical protein